MGERLRVHAELAARSSALPGRSGLLARLAREAVAPRIGAVPGQPAPAGSGRALDAHSRDVMEAHLGHDFSRVRIHADRQAAESAEARGARAYTVGRDVVFGPGAYAPDTGDGARLLAHELTHVVQQTTATGAPGSYARAENEAARNSRALGEGRRGTIGVSFPVGSVQREDKPATTVSGERGGTREGKDKFSFKADLTLPVPGDLSFGSVSFLDDLKLSGSGSLSSAAGLGTGPADLDAIKLQLALALAKLEIANVKKKEDALRRGKLSFGSTLSASGGPTFKFNPADTAGSLGVSLENKLGATTPSLIPSGAGTLTLGASLSGSAALTQGLGADSGLSPKVESKAGASADFASRPLPALGGQRITAGLTGSASSAIAPEKITEKLSAGASVGTSGKALGSEFFVKLQVSGDVTVDYSIGSVSTTTRSFFVGASTGFKFGK
jgi:hypothetical protein